MYHAMTMGNEPKINLVVSQNNNNHRRRRQQQQQHEQECVNLSMSSQVFLLKPVKYHNTHLNHLLIILNVM